jgi:hypothetical protein
LEGSLEILSREFCQVPMGAFGRFPIEIFNHGICPLSMSGAADRSLSPLTTPRLMPPAADNEPQ